MTFRSILRQAGAPQAAGEKPLAPAFAGDINFDQIIEAVTAGRQEYDLEEFFHSPLLERDEILYRQEVMRDLERDDLSACIRTFSARMAAMRAHLRQVEKMYFQLQKERWFLEAAATYCQAAQDLLRALAGSAPGSRGLRAFQDCLARYVGGEAFSSLSREAQRIRKDLDEIRYTVSIKGATFRVQKYDQEEDYGQAVARFFEKFKQGAGKDWGARFHEWPVMNQVEEKILTFVSQLFPEPFSALAQFCARHAAFQDGTLQAFDREVQFYLGYLEFTAPLRQAGLPFCYPELTRESKESHALDFFDLALAHKLVPAKGRVVVNDFRLRGKERVIVVTGPNQGGKTTFARAFAQVHALARLGCPVPGREARLFLFDQIHTHFEQEEATVNLRGKLQDELVRIHGILAQAGPGSLIVINEIFAATTWQDATIMAKQVVARILDLDAVCVCVTFLDELAGLGEGTVSMVSTVEPGDDQVRTFRIVRQPADGLAYALSLAGRFRLTHGQLLERL
jgi:hypothetical protein